MTIADWIKDYINDFYNALLCWVVKRTYLKTTTIWNIMRRVDNQFTPKRLECLINEYKKGSNKK